MLTTYNPTMIRKAVIVVLTSIGCLLLGLHGCELASTWGIEGLDSIEHLGICVEPIRTETTWLRPCLSSRRLRIEAALATSKPSPDVHTALRVPLGGMFSYAARDSTQGRRFYWLAIPSWLVSASILAYPTIALIRGPLRRWRRHRKGLCTECGCNLRGLTEPSCPECSTEFDPPTLPSTPS